MKELTQEVTKTTSLHDAQLVTLSAKMESNHHYLLNRITSHKRDEEESTDQLIKAMKTMVRGELQKSESTLISEVHFMIEQAQLELQKDIRAAQDSSQKDSKDK